MGWGLLHSTVPGKASGAVAQYSAREGIWANRKENEYGENYIINSFMI
jgi:hypothetical protein